MMPGPTGGGPTFNQIGTGRFGQVLTRLFQMRGLGTPANAMSPEIMPVFEVNGAQDPSLYFLRGERLLSAGASIGAGGAGTFASMCLWNPANSGVLARVSALMFNFPVGTAAVQGEAAAAGLTNLTPATSLDWRYGIPAGAATPGVCQFSVGVPIAIPPTAAMLRLSPLNVQAVQLTVIMVPGSRLMVSSFTANQPLTDGWFQWSERAFYAEENVAGG